MRSKILLGFWVVTASAFWLGNPIYGLGARIYPCDMPFARASECNNLRGPVHTVELSFSYPDNQDPSMQDAAATHTLLTYSEEGLLIGREIWKNGVVQSRNQYEKRDGGLTIVDESEWIENGQEHRSEDVVSLNQQGDTTSRESRLDAGAFTVYYKREVDSTGREASIVSCSTDGKNCISTRTESEYDGQGRLTLTKVIELPSGRVELHTEYEYPAENRRRTLAFGGFCRDSNAPASLPTYVIEATYDSAGRVIEETTSAPGYSKPEKGISCLDDAESPHPGRIVRRYDDQGRLLDETDSATGEHRSYSYDQAGNLVSQRAVQDGGGEMQFEFSYEYDQFGNWKSKTSYDSDSKGQRGKAWRIDYQKLTYYPQ